MTNDAAFLEALLDAPNDNTLRLVYADWLDERNDPRAELLRLDCRLTQMRGGTASAERGRLRLEGMCLAAEADWVALVRRQAVTDRMEVTLKRLEYLLAGLNYVVSFGIHRVPRLPNPTPERYICTALGLDAVVGGLQPVTGGGLLATVERCVRYPGDRGHGPEQSALTCEEFQQHVNDVLLYLQRSAAESNAVTTFWLREGHPFYPVMWDFAYLFEKQQYAVIFIGSSSD